LLEVAISNQVASESKKTLLKGLTSAVAKAYSKPEMYVAVKFEQNVAIMFGGDPDTPAAVCRLGSIGGVNSKNNSELQQAVASLLQEHASIDSSRIFCLFHDLPASNWGMGTSTLA